MASSITVAAVRRSLSAPESWTIRVASRLASTNTTALEWVAAGVPPRTALIAESQTAGRGRNGRTWKTPRGTALALSVILPPPRNPRHLSWMPLAAAVATADAIESLSDVRCRFKWPNDVLIDGKKVAGILTEVRGGSARPSAVVIGIGVNVNNRAAALPGGVGDLATSLLDATGRTVDRNRLAAEILNRLGKWSTRLAGGSRARPIVDVRRRWTVADATAGQYVSVLTPRGRIEGVDRGLNQAGHLVLEPRKGPRRVIRSGEVLLCRTVGPPLI